jgi:type IV pilus assembly protein PilB
VERQAVTEEQLREAIEQQHRSRKRLGEVLIELGYASADTVLDGLSAQLGVPPTRVNSYTVTPEAVSCLSEKVARKYSAVPLLKVGTSLVVATANPRDLQALDDLRFAAGCAVQTMVALEAEIQAAIDRCYGSQFALRDESDDHGLVVVDEPGPQLDLQDEAQQKSATTLVDRIVARAVADRASDVHLEPTRHNLRVRFRIDGMFHDVASLLPAVSPAVIARLKVLSGMDIAVNRTPQDGRFSATINTRGIDVRMSTYPTIWGEKAVLRLLDRTALQLSIDRLMGGETREAFRTLIHRPEGIVLVTGPTGSGKTSTLYAAVSELAEQGRNITTIEDPVEYWLPGVNQGQTNPKAGFTFARGLRAILRQDPDVIMVGEIRDSETLDTAVEASLTGHLVLATLHTSGSIPTLTRLLEMGVEPHVLSSAVTGVMAQRLVRRICEHCRKASPVAAAVRPLFGVDPPDQVHHGAGCQSCQGIGYRGRAGVYELLTIGPELRRAICARATEDELLEIARQQGLRTLADQALALVRDGTTTIDEVSRVVQEWQAAARRTR